MRLARLFWTGAFIPAAVFVAAWLLVTVFTRPIFTRSIVTGTIIAARLLLGLRARGLGQVDQMAVIVANHAKAFGGRVGLCLGGLVASTILGTVFAAPVIAVTLLAVAIAAAIAILLELLTRLLFGGLLTHGFGQKAGIMFCVLQEILGRHAVVRQLRIAGKHLIFFNNLLRRAAHLAFGARAVEDTVDDIAEGTRAVLLGTRAGLGRAHLDL